jgi:hypothetical protein
MRWTRFHPISRIAIVLALVLSAASFTGWERVGIALATIHPAGSFDARCEALPANEVAVTVLPIEVREDRATSVATLTGMWGEAAEQTHRTIGLTRARFGHRSTVEVKGIEDRNGMRACVRPRVAVELYLQPLTVYVAREYAADPCRSDVIRGHEERHVAVYREFVNDAAPRLSRELAGVVGDRTFRGSTILEAQRSIDRRIGETLVRFMRDAEASLAERQAQVDTPEEYARVQNACS